MTEPSTADLPSFAEPPVVEVALSVQFSAPPWHAPQLGPFWELVREDFPRIEEHAPLAPLGEEFGAPRPAELRVELVDRPPAPRYWFLSRDGASLIQVQNDRFAHNWRKADESQPYPSYEGVRDVFAARFRQFVNSVWGADPTTFKPNWCEITYVDHVLPNSHWSTHAELHRVLRLVAPASPSDFRPDPEDEQLTVRFVMRDSSGEPLGRLQISATPAYRRADHLPIYVLTFTARGLAHAETIEGALAFLDRGHEWIVRTFVDLTTEEMHSVWRRER